MVVAVGRVDLRCPFAEKDEAKGLGAAFDWTSKVWYVPAGRDLAPFSRWLPADWPGCEERRVERRGAAAGELGEVDEVGERVVAVEDVGLPASEPLAAAARRPVPPPRSRSTPPAARTHDAGTSGSGSSASSTRAPSRSAAAAAAPGRSAASPSPRRRFSPRCSGWARPSRPCVSASAPAAAAEPEAAPPSARAAAAPAPAP